MTEKIKIDFNKIIGTSNFTKSDIELKKKILTNS
tara:strand:+ start:266 stop:367 length:102 start_codon:yes stop_codon:yes gene_type:complete